MPIDKKTALEQIDAVLERYKLFRNPRSRAKVGFEVAHTELVMRMMETLRRLAPPGSMYRVRGTDEDELAGVLKALRADYEADYLQTFRELLHGETFSNFLDMATHLLSEGYKVAAAVIAGGVLEQHLRALCTKLGVSPVPSKLGNLNTALYRDPPKAYSSHTMKQITAWADIRNSAAHGHYDEVDAKQVELMIDGIRLFVQSHAA
jgi:hypothetical protein